MLCAPDGPGSPGPFAAALYAAASEPAGFRNRAAVRRKESFGPAGRIPAGLGTGVGGAAADCAGGNPDGGSLFPGPPLWEAPVSLSVEAGVSVSETLRRILAASGTGISLLAFPGPDPVRTRGQAFYGRAAECAEEALSAVPARACLSPAGLRVIPAEGLPVSLYLTDRDLIDTPFFTDGQMILRTTVTGWPVGERISVKWKDGSAEGLVTERRMDIDTLNGKWESMLLISLKADQQRQMLN